MVFKPATRLGHSILASLPLLATPLLFVLIAEGMLNFGGGEKDLILLIPWLIWSLVFAGSSYVLIYRHSTLTKWLTRSMLLATGTIAILGVVTYAASFLGMA